MKKLIGMMAGVALGLLVAACGGDDSFIDSLTLGTGMDAQNFELTGEIYTFSDGDTVYFRLESAADMGGSDVEIKIEQQLLGGTQEIATLPFDNPQSYGHILISSFLHNYGPGNFRAIGMLVTGNLTVATVEYSVE